MPRETDLSSEQKQLQGLAFTDLARILASGSATPTERLEPILGGLEAARTGLAEQSGITDPALQAALNQALTRASADVLGREARIRAERQPGDLERFAQFFIEPGLRRLAIQKEAEILRKQRKQQKLAALAGLASAIAGSFICAVAEELWGQHAPQTRSVRLWFLFRAPRPILLFYVRFGPTLAAAARRSRLARWALLAVFRLISKWGSRLEG